MANHVIRFKNLYGSQEATKLKKYCSLRLENHRIIQLGRQEDWSPVKRFRALDTSENFKTLSVASKFILRETREVFGEHNQNSPSRQNRTWFLAVKGNKELGYRSTDWFCKHCHLRQYLCVISYSDQKPNVKLFIQPEIYVYGDVFIIFADNHYKEGHTCEDIEKV